MVFVLPVAVVEETSGLAGMMVEGGRSWGIAEKVEGEMLFDSISIRVRVRCFGQIYTLLSIWGCWKRCQCAFHSTFEIVESLLRGYHPPRA
jgi:hypothetical protein